MNTSGRLFALTLLALIFACTTVAQTSSSLAGSSTTKTNPDAAISPEDKSGIADPLLRVLVAKGLLTAAEARSVTTGSVVEQRDRLAALLRDKGLITANDFEAVRSGVDSIPLSAAATPKPPELMSEPQSPSGPTKIAAGKCTRRSAIWTTRI